MLLSLASSLNGVPLPPILDRYGLKLPPPQHCLTNVNFSLVPNPPPDASSDGDAPGEDDEDEELNGNQEGEESDADASEQQGDASMLDSTTAEATAVEARGTKRNLDEDEDYD
jgi:transcription initiation factor TFIID subunit 9B